jgi:hypothetical protein
MAAPLILAGGLAAAQLAGNYMSGQAQREAAEIGAEAQIKAAQMGIDEQRAAYQDISPMYQRYMNIGDRALGRLSEGVHSGEFTSPEMQDFHYNRGVNEFLDPSMQYQQEQAQRALESSAALGGGLLSGGTLKGLQNQAQQFAQTDYGNAYNRMQSDKSFAYNEYLNRFNAQRQSLSDRYNQLSQLSNVGQGATSALANARLGTGSQVTNLLGQQGNAQAVQSMAAPMAQADMYQAIPQALGQAAGIYNQYRTKTKEFIPDSNQGDFYNQWGTNQGTGGLV